MITSEETTNLLNALISAAPELVTLSKSKQAYGYKYATLDSVIDMLRGVLPKYGLWFLQMPTRVENKSILTTRVFHTSGEWIEDSIEMTDTELGGKSNDTQRVGASITYFRRYALSSIFGIAADEDVDGDTSKQPTKASTAARAEAQPKPLAEAAAKGNAKPDPLDFIRRHACALINEGVSQQEVFDSYTNKMQRSIQSFEDLKALSPQELKALAIDIFKGGFR